MQCQQQKIIHLKMKVKLITLLSDLTPSPPNVDRSRQWKTRIIFQGRLQSTSARHTPPPHLFCPRHTFSALAQASRAVPASFWYQRFRTNRATILESGVVIR